ncbi:MAG: DUF4407 domain-containing protein [Bacteroidetes bacterium]|nr:DUF4407 domain-containing protein [Bacteroidota bacterium]
MKKITSFLLFASGADLKILEQCPTDKNKYIGIGGTVFFTGLFAALAAAYALFTVFDSYVLAILLGIVWGLMIFNLDRLIVSGIRKEDKVWREWLSALPRILLAVVISLVIARPFELKIFSKEIDPELVQMEQQVYAAQEQEAKSRFEPELVQIREDVNRLKQEITDKAHQRDQLAQLAQQEADGTGGSKIKNLGPIYKIKKADADKAELELVALEKENANKILALESLYKERSGAMLGVTNSLEHTRLNGPAARMEALTRLVEKSGTMWWAHIFIVMLFMVVELSPIIVKLFSKKGPYDSMLRSVEHDFICKEVESVVRASAEAKKQTAHLGDVEKEYVTRKLDAELI